MSHIETHAVNVKDLNIIIEAVKILGFTDIQQNGCIKDYYGKDVKVDLKIHNNIGLLKQIDGTYKLTGEFYRSKYSISTLTKQLNQTYSEVMVTNLLKTKRFDKFTKSTEKDGTVRIVYRGRGY